MITTRKPKPEITSAAIYRCTVKATGEIFYLVASDSVPGLFYQITWNAQACAWQCHCPSTKPCKHERALSQVQTAQFHARQAAEQSAATVIELEAQLEQAALIEMANDPAHHLTHEQFIAGCEACEAIAWDALDRADQQLAYRRFEAAMGAYLHPWA